MLRNNRFQIDQKLSVNTLLFRLGYPVYRSENKSRWNYTIETVKMQRGLRDLFVWCFFRQYRKYQNGKIAGLILKSSDGEYFSLKRNARCFRDNGRSTKTSAKSRHRMSQLLSSHLPHFFFVIPLIDRYSILSLFSRCSWNRQEFCVWQCSSSMFDGTEWRFSWHIVNSYGEIIDSVA